MPVTRWLRENAKGILGAVMQAVVNVFGSLIAFSDQVSKALNITFTPFFFLILFGTTFIGLGLIAWNGRDKAERRRLFGEPFVTIKGVRQYQTRYDLPRLDFAFEQAKKRILILGRALNHTAMYDMQLVREAIKAEREVCLYFLSPESKLAESDTLNPSTPNFRQYIHLGLEAAENARRSYPEEYRSRLHIFTYDPEAETVGTYIIFDPERASDSVDYKIGGWTKAQRLQIEQPVKGRDISHSGNQISTWKDNKEFIKSQLEEFNNCMRNVVEHND
jgi:hypothetical protein